MNPRILIGYGGGKGGDGAARAPVESPNTLHSPSWARVVDLLCEGEIEGLADFDVADANAALKSIFLNGVPVRNQDGSYNFKGVGAYGLAGTQSQEYIPGFTDVESEIAVAVEVTHATPIVRTVTDPNIDAVVVTVEVPQLYHVDDDGDPPTGDMLPTSVEISIEVQSNGGGYVAQDLGSAATISGKCTKAYDRGYRIPLNGSAPWDIKVSRVTLDNGSTSLQNQTFWKSYTQLIDQKLSYPNSALIGLEIPATQFNSIPSRSYLVKGLRVKVPTNYDPATRVYTGSWDGTFKVAWTDNPAWCFYDLLTTSRYGLGKYIDAASVDKWGLYAIGQYCDELVPDGKGGTEPRFRCNLYLQSQQDAYRVVNDMASIFRAMAYWASGAVQLAQDSPADPEYLFTPANVIDGDFTYTSSAKRARHSVAIVSWNDPTNHYVATREYVTDEDGLAEVGYQPVEVAAFGCTSQGQAQRVGRWLLFTERLETETVTFKTGLEGALRNPGAIITIQDPYRAGKRLGGRIVSATTTQIELDADVAIEAGKTYSLSVLLPDGTVEEQAVSSAPSTYRTLTLAAPLSVAPSAQAMWVLTVSDLVPVYYRVLSVTEDDDGTYQVTALRHEPGKYALVENGVKIQSPPTSVIPSSLSPTNLVVSEALYKNTSGIRVRLQASWDQNPAATKYAVRWRQDGGNWSNEELVDAHFWERLDVTPGLYWVQVQAIVAGLRTDSMKASYQVLGKTAPPADVTGLAAAVHPLSTTISWTEVADLDLDHYEVRIGGTDWATATLFADAATNAFEWGHPAAGTYTMRVKAVDTSGNYSTNAANVTFTVSNTIGTANIASGAVVPAAMAPGIDWGNIPLNGDFEATNLAGAPPDSWAMGSGVWNTSFQLETGTVYSGSHSIRAVDNSGAAELVSETFPVQSGLRYTVQGSTLAFSMPAAGALIFIDWYRGDLTLIQSDPALGPPHALFGSWNTVVGGEITAPANALYARLRIYKPAGTGTSGDWLVDRVRVKEAEILSIGWSNLVPMGSWTDVVASQDPGYYKDPVGRVHMRGRVTGGGSGVLNPIIVLPAGWRPGRIVSYATAFNSTCVQIDTAGNVFLAAGPNTDVSLDGIDFRAEN
jgi:predicted phage tail protein